VRADADRGARRGRLLAPTKTIALGVLLLIGACWFLWYEIGGNPLTELALIRRAEVTTGTLVETYEIEHDTDRGVYVRDAGIYVYRLPDGREFRAYTRVPTGQLKEQQQVEYLPDRPGLSRIKGDGCQTVTEWLWRKVGLGLLLLAALSAPGIMLIRSGQRDMSHILSVISIFLL
jgi:hypothetical protein